MNIKAWMLAVSLAALSSLPISAGVFYSPVFNMPLQPAPSPCNGGFYWVLPDCRVFGPNYCLYPPFTPMSGFDNALVGQTIFAKLFDEACKGTTNKKGGHPGHSSGGATPPTKQVGLTGYNIDFSDPDWQKKFDTPVPMPSGYVPFAPTPASQPPYGNGPMPMPRYANYPNFQAAAGGYGYGPAAMNWRAPQSSYYAPAYGQGFHGAYGQSPVVQVQAQAAPPYSPPPFMPAPQGIPTGPAPAPANLPGMPSWPGVPSMPYCPMPLSASMPYLPTPNYSMPQPWFPPLPNPCYEPPCQEPCRMYYHNPLVRSPRDYFMWSEVKEQREERARRPMTVP